MTDVVLPKLGQSGSNEWADVEDNDTALRDFLNNTGVHVYQPGSIDNAAVSGSAAIAYSKLASMATGKALIGNAGTPTATTLSGDVTVGATGVTAIGSGKVTNAMLASPNASVYRTLLFASSYIGDTGGGNPTADTYALGSRGGGSGAGSILGNHAPVDGPVAPLIYLQAADHAASGLTTKLRLSTQVLTNATAPGINFIVRMYLVDSVAGGADLLGIGGVTSQAASTSTVTAPSASSFTRADSGDFNIVADGYYMLGVVTSGQLANNSMVAVHAQLQVHNV